MFKFFYAKEAEQYLFYRIPQMLFTEEKFRLMSCEGKVLYGLLLDRVGLSRRNGCADDEGRLYIYYTQGEACEKLNVRKNKIIKIYLELEQVGLIQRKKQGFGKPTKIYVMNFAKSDDETLKNETGNEDVDDEDICEMSELPQSKPQDFLETNVRISLKQTSGLPKNKTQDFPETNPNHTIAMQ